MSAAIELDVAGVVVDSDLGRGDAEQLGARLEQAFALLADRLGDRSGAAQRGLGDLTIPQMVIELDDIQSALGPAGPQMLADELLRQILRSCAV